MCHVDCHLRAQIGTAQKKTNLINTQIKQVGNGDELRDVAGRLRDVAGRLGDVAGL